MVNQLLSIVGAIVILAAYGGQQLRRLDTESVMFQIMNFVGGFCLCGAAIILKQYGFILLEGAWTLISAAGLWRVAVTRRS